MKVEIERRPLLCALIGLAGGILAFELWWAWIALLAALIFVSPWRSRVALTVTAIVGYAIAPSSTPATIESSRPFAAEARIAEPPQLTERGYAANVATDQGLIRLTWSSPTLSFGDVVWVDGQLKPLREGSEKFATFRGVIGRIDSSEQKLRVLSFGPAPFRWGSQWRESFVAFAGATLAPTLAASAEALTFNVDDRLSQDFRDNLQRTGTIHIISASGAHVLIVAFGALFLLGLAPIPRWLQLCLLLALLVLYAMAAGFRPPIVRAALMTALGLTAYWVRREPDHLSALAIAAIGYLLWDSASLYDIGFQLSFTTVGALTLWGKWVDRDEQSVWWRAIGRVGDLARAGAVAWLGSVPLVAYYFGSVSLISIPANLAIAAFVTPALSVSLGAHLVSFLWPGLGYGLMALIVGPSLIALEWCVNALATIPFAAIQVPSFSPWWIALYYALWLAAWRRRVRLA